MFSATPFYKLRLPVCLHSTEGSWLGVVLKQGHAKCVAKYQKVLISGLRRQAWIHYQSIRLP